MININQNVTNIEKFAEDINQLTKEYNDIIEKIFLKVESSKEHWTGEDGEEFFAKVEKEREYFDKFGLTLANFANETRNTAILMSETQNNLEEERGR